MAVPGGRAAVIRSRDNPRYRGWLKLAVQVRERRRTGLTLLDGIHLLQALAESGGQPEALILRDDDRDSREIAALLIRFPQVPCYRLSHALFDALVPSDHPVGIAALYRTPEPPAAAPGAAALLLEDIQDPGNLGAILRTAAAADVRSIYLSAGCADVWSPKTLRAGMGAHFELHLTERANLLALLSAGQRSLALQPEAVASLYDQDLTGAVAFVLGNEGAGLSQALAAAASLPVSIPMPGSAESLNVAAAAAICLFERVRQRRNMWYADTRP